MQNTIQVPVKGAGGEDRGQLELGLDQLDSRVRYPLLKEASLMYLANRRVGTHATKTRANIAGSTRKPWKQKGTGRARAGSKKSPLWRGGGVVFGPHPRDYSYAINRKQRQQALRSALYSKFRDGQVLVLEGFATTAPKTRAVAAALKALGVTRSCLVGTAEHDRNLYLSARNLPGVVVTAVKDFNALDVLNARTIILLRDAYDALLGGPLLTEPAADPA